MKKSKFTERQILETLQEAESGVQVAEVCRKRGISVATFYQWKRKYAGMTVSELKRVKELEAENARLKRMYADMALENAAIKDVLSRGHHVLPTFDFLARALAVFADAGFRERQPVVIYAQSRAGRVVGAARDQACVHPSTLSLAERESGTVQPDPANRVGLPAALPKQSRTR